jgi:hypothetical protein
VTETTSFTAAKATTCWPGAMAMTVYLVVKAATSSRVAPEQTLSSSAISALATSSI